LVVHTGDFKLSETAISGMMTNINKFARFGDRGVLALLSDSTNVERGGHTLSDERVGETLGRIIQNSPGRVIIALFASNVARIQQIVEILSVSRRKLIFNGKSIELSAQIAKQLGMLHIPPDMEIGISEIDAYAPDELVILTTGSQGEPMSALTRMSAGMHKHIRIEQGDTVVLSSKFIPGNEKAIAKIINNLFRKGAEVIYETISDIHVSGHAFRDELRMMINMTMPEYFIPIHGEYRHLYHHARLAAECGVPPEKVLLAEDGQVIRFDSEGGRIEGPVATSRVLVDGKGVGDVGRSVLKERRLLSEKGLVVVILVFDEATGFIVQGPDIVSKGFVFQGETGHIIEDAKCIILELIDDMERYNPPDPAEFIRSRLPRELREYFNFTMKRKPVIVPVVLAV
jgi:ribonuclease J